MKKLLILLGVLLAAGAAQAFDIFRLVKTTQTLSLSTTLSATTLFVDPTIAKIACTATCWVAVHSTNVETVVSAAASELLLADTTVYYTVPASRYVIMRRDSVNGKAYITGLEMVR